MKFDFDPLSALEIEETDGAGRPVRVRCRVHSCNNRQKYKEKIEKGREKKTRLKLDIVSFVGRNSHTGCQETNRDELSKKNPNKKIRKLTGEREHEK